MKKFASAMLLFLMIVTLPACSNLSEAPKALTKEGVAPYELSDSEKSILQLFNMEDTSQVISFKAPKEAISLNINTYRLEAGEKWIPTGGGSISNGTERVPIDQLIGTFAMQLKENHTIDFHIDAGGRSSYKTDEIVLEGEKTASAIYFLQEFQDITVNTEIPVALMVYDDSTAMGSYTLQDFFAPSKLAGADLVQAVTLEFSDK